MTTTSRRQFLKTTGGVTLGMLAVSGMGSLLSSCSTEEKAAAIEVPWPYDKVDPELAAERAYERYYQGGCMYGGFEGVVGELKASVGAPYTAFPSVMMKYGGGGVAGWGSLCGALNGAAAAISLTSDPAVRNKIISELYAWYSMEALPTYKPKSPKFDSIQTSVAGSQLCHVSVTKWSNATGIATGDPQRAERCAWLTASVAKYTAELLNQQMDGTFALVHPVPAEVQSCLSCHGPEASVGNVHIKSQSDCIACHATVETDHPVP